MQISARTFWALVLTSVVGAFGLGMNPWFWSGDQILLIEVFVAGGWLSYEFCRAARRERTNQAIPTLQEPADRPATRFPLPGISPGAWLILGLVILLWAFVYRVRWLAPVRMPDDDGLFAGSVDWWTTWDQLFEPMADHVMVATRLLTFLVTQFSDEGTRDAAGAVVSAALFVPSLCLLFLVAYREWRSELAGLLAVTLFALTTTYREIIVWYTASCQWLITLNLLLLAILVTGKTRPKGWHVAVVFLLAFVAPLNFSFGVLVGPLTALWTAVRTPHQGRTHGRAMIVGPIVGSVAGTVLLTILWLNWSRGAELRVDIWKAMILSARLTIDVLGFHNLGLHMVLTKSWHAALFPVVPVILVMLLRLLPAAWRLLPMLAMIVLGYGWTVSFRTWVDYYQLVTWTRYQLFPQLGLALFLTGILVLSNPRALDSQGGHLTLPQGTAIVGLAIVLTCMHSGLVN